MKPEKQLYQWDVNQYLTGINPAAQYVDYKIDNEVIRLETDSTRCRIPDEVLQTYGGKTCYERYPDGTYRAYSFTVLYAPKPPDYVYTAEERTTFDALVAKADAAIAEIKRRADSGEFTPKKGVDYFTDAEKAEMMESVSDGAIGEFRKVVDTATTEYNVNHTEKMTAYDTNASEKLTTYDTNAEQHTTDYNRNAEVKLEAYNSNHAAKVAEYNANAETKTAEFDSNAAALQTEVDRLRGECDTLKAENRKQENRIDALMKLNKGQTYDILPEDGESASRTAPSGAKYVGIDKVGGKSVAWNQLIAGGYAAERSKVLNEDYAGISSPSSHNKIANHKYLLKCKAKVNVETSLFFQLVLTDNITETQRSDSFNLTTEYALVSAILTAQYNYSSFSSVIRANREYDESVTLYVKECQVFDLTQMFGSTIADYVYSLEQSQAGAGVAWFKKLFPADHYPYSEPTIISSQTDRVDVRGKNLWDEEWEVGRISWSGANENSQTDRIRSKNYIEVDEKSSYYIFGNRIQLFYYDDNKQLISYESNSKTNAVFITPEACRYVRFFVYDSTYGIEYKNDIAIIKGTSGSYSPYSLEQITTGFPVLNSAGSVYDYIDLNEGKLHQRVGVKDLGTLNYTYITSDNIPRFRATPSGIKEGCQVVSSMYVYTGQSFSTLTSDKTVANFGPASIRLEFRNDSYTDAAAFKAAMSGVMLYYELAEEVITDIEIPTELTDWLEVEAGGSVTFHDADESKQLAVPNAVSWVRKLNEVE